jgi:hypothetical protein
MRCGLANLVSRNLLLYLVNYAFEGSQRQLVNVKIRGNLVRSNVIAFFERAQFFACVGQFDIRSQSHSITSIKPFSSPKRSNAKNRVAK